MYNGGYRIENQNLPHFLTLTVVEWIDVFTRKMYRDILLDSIRHCQMHKGLLLHCWCIMSNHLHMIASSPKRSLSDTLRDFKKYTSKRIIKAIHENPAESRKGWMLSLFNSIGEGNHRNKDYQFWIQDNHPIELQSPGFILQRMNYTHDNPVRAGIVDRQEEYRYSSARDYLCKKGSGLLEIVYL